MAEHSRKLKLAMGAADLMDFRCFEVGLTSRGLRVAPSGDGEWNEFIISGFVPKKIYKSCSRGEISK